MKKRSKVGPVFIRWILTLIGGAFMGIGIFILGQAELLAYIKKEVDSTFFLLRWIGKVSFIFMAIDTKLALALAEIPEEIVRESVRWARAFIVIGACFAILAFFIKTPRSPRDRGRPGKLK